MLTKRGFHFEFEIPDDWEEEKQGTRYVFHGPNGEELIVSGRLIEGSGGGKQIDELRTALLEGAKQIVQRTAADPDLVTVRPLGDDGAQAGFHRLTMDSRTTKGDVVFSQAIFADDVGLMLVTFEAPYSVSSLGSFRSFLDTVRRSPVM